MFFKFIAEYYPLVSGFYNCLTSCSKHFSEVPENVSFPL